MWAKPLITCAFLCAQLCVTLLLKTHVSVLWSGSVRNWPLITFVQLWGQSRLGSHLRAHSTGKQGGGAVGLGRGGALPVLEASEQPGPWLSIHWGKPAEPLWVDIIHEAKKRKRIKKIYYFWKIPTCFIILFNSLFIYFASLFLLAKWVRWENACFQCPHSHISFKVKKKHLTKKTFIYADVSVFCRPEKLYFELNVYFYVVFRQGHWAFLSLKLIW